MDKVLVQQYAAAVQARPLLQHLPDGLREHAQLFELMCLQDIRAQTGNPNLTEQEILNEAKPTISKIIVEVWPLIYPILLNLIKKHFPAVATSGILSAIATYLATK